MSKISIIIPVYNSEKYIRDCINSIINQSYKDIEILAIDDGSADSSLKILNELAENDKRLRVFSKENGGVSSTRNLGISKATGEFISFVDSDDELPINALETLYKNIDDNVDLVSGSHYVRTIRTQPRIHNNMVILPEEKYSRFTEYDKTNWGPWGKLYRKSIIDKYNIRFSEDVTYGEDHIFNLNYTKNTTGNLVVLSECVYIYNNRLRQNLCSRAIEDIAVSQKMLFETIYHYFDEVGIEKAIEYRYLYSMLQGSIEHYIVFFGKDSFADNIEKTFRIFEEHITPDFLKEKFSDAQAENILNKNYNDFAALYLEENPNIKKRIIKNKIKKLLNKML